MQPLEDPGNAVPSKEVAAEVAAEEEDEEADIYPSGVALWSILVPVTIGYFLMFLDTCVVATASPVITIRFDSLIDIGWYGGAYQLGNSAVQPLTGKIYSHFSTKAGCPNPYCLPSLLGASERERAHSNLTIQWTYLVFFLIFELGSAIAGAAVSSPMFIVGRAIAGAGASGIGTGALVIISCVLPVRKQAKALGMNMGIGQMGIALGPIIGGAFTEYASWRWCE